jgi:tetratricopeptide (TPR) repeat protein
MRKSFLWNTLALFLLVLYLGCAPSAKAGKAGTESIENVYLFENHYESYLHWKKHNVENRILVHFDGHIDMDWIPEPLLEEILSCKTVEDLERLAIHPYKMKSGFQGKISIWNFIYPAVRSGMVKDFYWVVPDGTLKRQHVLKHFRSTLAIKMHGVTPSEIESLKLEEKRISGKLFGVPFTVVEMDEIPQFDEPVLLDIDVDYFSTDSGIDQRVLLDPSLTPAAFLERLIRKEMSTDLVTISYSSVGGYLPVPYHYFGDMIAEKMKDPQSTRSEEDFKKAAKQDLIYQHKLLHDADALRGAGKAEEAILSYKQYINESPGSPYLPYAKRRLATTLADFGQPEDAIKELRNFLSESPDEPDARYYLGRLNKEGGNFKEAVQELRKAVELDNFNGIYAAELGASLLRLKEEEQALKWLEKALELKPCNANAHLALASHYWSKQDLNRTAEELKKALFIRPWNPDAHYFLGGIYYKQQKVMAAVEEWRKVLEIAPSHVGARRELHRLGWSR